MALSGNKSLFSLLVCTSAKLSVYGTNAIVDRDGFLRRVTGHMIGTGNVFPYHDLATHLALLSGGHLFRERNILCP
jgi:hypothetical protein